MKVSFIISEELITNRCSSALEILKAFKTIAMVR